MDNIGLFEYSLKNQEQAIIDDKKKELIVLPKNAKKKSKFIEKNERLINLLTAYQTMEGRLTKEQNKEVIDEIDSILFKVEHMNYSALSQYLMVWGMPWSSLSKFEDEKRKTLLQDLIVKYIKDRHRMYVSHGYSNIVLQVVSDNYAHKRGASTGTDKIISFVGGIEIEKYSEGDDVRRGQFYLLPDKEKRRFIDICKQRGIKNKWSKSKQSKMPDCYIQKGPKSWII